MTKVYGDKAVVENISLQVREGDIYGFLGPDGSGKATFIRMVYGLRSLKVKVLVLVMILVQMLALSNSKLAI